MTQSSKSYIPRVARSSLENLASQFRVVSVVGPRQSGKTTLLKKVFPDKPYVSLEDLQNRSFAEQDPIGFLAQFEQGAFIDEVQNVPDLLSQIQVRVDQSPARGQFILSGSNNLLVSALGSQSLAGRSAPFLLLPLSIEELFAAKLIHKDMNLNVQLKGGYPEIWEQNISPTLMSSAYITNYVERDVRQIANIGDLATFKSFLELAASNVGQLLNKESFSNALGISAVTIERWISILEATYVVFRLQPWKGNIKKRLVKTPKLFFYDCGLLCYLLGIESEEVLASHPLRGQIFENLQLVEYFKWAYNNNRSPRANFFRDSSGKEVDLICMLKGKTQAIEIKSSQTFKTIFTENIQKFYEIVREQHKPIIVLGASESQRRTHYDVVPWYDLAAFLNDR